MNRRLIATAALLFVAFLIADLALGQDFASERDALQLQLDTRISKIEGWQTCARTTMILTLAVGLLGIAVGALQAHKNPKLATIIIGGVISSLTMINSTIYKVDHHTFNRAASQAQQCIEEATLMLARKVHTAEEWDFLKDEFREQIRAIDLIEGKILGEGSAQDDIQLTSLDRLAGTLIAWSSVFVATAEAGDAQPRWITRVPKAKDSIFFVGASASASLKQASELSRRAAVEESSQYFGYLAEQAQAASRAPVEASRLLHYLSKSVEVADSYYAFDETQKVYRFYTLIKLRRQSIATDLEFIAISQKRTIPKAIVLQLAQAEGPSPDFYTEHGNRLVLQRKYGEAIACFEKALAMDGQHTSARRYLEAAKTAAQQFKETF